MICRKKITTQPNNHPIATLKKIFAYNIYTINTVYINIPNDLYIWKLVVEYFSINGRFLSCFFWKSNIFKYVSTCQTCSFYFWIMNAMCTFMYLFVVYFSFDPGISASIHRYGNYFDIQVLMMVTETETLTSTLHHNIFTYLDYAFSATFIYIYIYIYIKIGRSTKGFVFFRIYLSILFLHTCMFPASCFVREHIWQKALLMGYSMRLDAHLNSFSCHFFLKWLIYSNLKKKILLLIWSGSLFQKYITLFAKNQWVINIQNCLARCIQ